MQALHKFMLIHVLTCLGQNALGSEIINGDKAPENDLLYMVFVQDTKGYACGGALVTEDFVLTAAHCDHGNPTKVVLGTHNRKKGGETAWVNKKCKHPSYVNLKNGHDLMLLKLYKKVRPRRRVQFIQLPSSKITLEENETCRVAGWGLTNTSSRTLEDDLRVVDVSVISPQVCREQWPGLHDSVICAGGYKTTKGFCQGDSGGPLVCRGMAVGVVSFGGRSCDYPDLPNGYADISADLAWINKILKEKNCFST